MEGRKVSLSLDEQRRYLRTTFENLKGEDEFSLKRRFINKLVELTEYKNKFWLNGNIEKELIGFPERELIQLCLKFLKDLNNSLTIPLLCRYYHASIKNSDRQLFVDAVKAITAFVVLRRSATGSTANIDSDLRALMANGRRINNKSSVPLSVGLDADNELLDSSILREYLREWLNKNRININSKSSWLDKVTSQPLYSSSAPLCRFLLLAAYHNARQDEKNPGMLVKQRASQEIEFLTYKRWLSIDTATVEHVAPDSNPGKDWDPEIYSQPHLKDSLGNLTLLPQKENSAVGNKSWGIKKMLYQAFAAETTDEIENIIEGAKRNGFVFSKINMEILKRGSHLPLAKSIAMVDNWNHELIEKRSRNIAELAWDEIAPWLFDA